MKYVVKDTSLSAIGEAIREKTGKTDLIPLFDMPGEIRSIEGGGISLSDNLVIPPGESLVPPYGECLYTINADGTVTIDAQNRDFIWMHSYDMYDEVTGSPTVFSFLPIKNGNKKYKLTVITDEDVEGTVIVRYSTSSYGQVDVCTFDIKDRSGAATFTTPEAYAWLEYIYLPCLPDKTVTYTFDLREVLEKEDNYEDGFEAGKKAEYDTFWDIYQEYGNRANYSLAFAGNGWTDITYKPKYDIKPTNATQMYYGAMIKEIGIDFSDCTNFSQCFAQSSVEVIDTVDMRKCTVASSNLYTFWATKLHTINKLIVDSTVPFNKNFLFNAGALVNLTIEGDIGQDGFDIHWSKLLSRDSIESIINALSSSEMGLTVTLSETAVNNAFTEGEWTELANTKNNWNIYLV